MPDKWLYRYQIAPGRWLFCPTESSRKLGRTICERVLEKWTPPRVYAHMHSGGHLSALRSHLGHRYFYRADLKDFFGSIGRSRVIRVLKPLFGYRTALDYAADCVVKHPEHGRFVLPHGFVQSPLLATLALHHSRLGAFIRRVKKSRGVQLSVYVDDILISADSESELASYSESLVDAAQKSGFPINEEKLQGPDATITAFNITVSQASMSITDERMNRFKAAVEMCSSEAQVRGIHEYIRSVSQEQFDCFLSSNASALAEGE